MPNTPDLQTQRDAMKKLAFLVGKWEGDARIFRGPGAPLELAQTEEAQYKLGGLLLLIEGIGRNKTTGEPALQALGITSYDDHTGTYRMRAFNDGHWLETEIQLQGGGITWGFTFAEIKTHSVMRINEKGEWTETTELTIGAQPPRKYMEVAVRPVK